MVSDAIKITGSGGGGVSVQSLTAPYTRPCNGQQRPRTAQRLTNNDAAIRVQHSILLILYRKQKSPHFRIMHAYYEYRNPSLICYIVLQPANWILNRHRYPRRICPDTQQIQQRRKTFNILTAVRTGIMPSTQEVRMVYTGIHYYLPTEPSRRRNVFQPLTLARSQYESASCMYSVNVVLLLYYG